MRPAVDVYARHSRGLQPHVPEGAPVVQVAGIVVQQQVVLQVARPQQRMRGVGYELRAADRRDAQRQELVNVESRIVAPTIEYRDVGIGEPRVYRRALGDRASALGSGLAQPRGHAHVDLADARRRTGAASASASGRQRTVLRSR